MTIAIEQKIIQLKELFMHENIKVDNDWLSGCVEWFLSEEPNISADTLYNKSMEQWLLADLSEIGISCIPDSVVDISPIMLDGKFPVQMQYLADIAEPSYEQLRNLYNKKLDEADDEENQRQPRVTKKKRVLKLELTDGHKTVIGMEYLPIACLHTKLSPGCKILLTGPMRCVNKVIFLEPKNVKILGGEVEKLNIINAFENVLLRVLGKPINPKPKTEYTETIVLEQPHRQKINCVKPMPTTFSNPQNNVDIFEDDDLLLNVNMDMLEQNIYTPNSVASEFTNVLREKDTELSSNLFNDDDDFILMESVSQNNNYTSNRLENYHFNDNSVDDFNLQHIENQIQNEARSQRNDERESEVLQIITKTDQTIITDNIDSLLPQKPNVPQLILDSNYEYKIRGLSLVTIDQLFLVSDEQKEDTNFIIKAKIDNVVEKLEVKNCEWSIGIYLTDNSERILQVRLSNEVLTKLSGISAREMQLMKKQQKEKPQIVDDLTDILLKLKETLTNLYCYMQINYSRSAPFPIVVELIESALTLDKIYQNKLLTEKNVR